MDDSVLHESGLHEIDLLVGSMFTVQKTEDREAFDEEREWISDIQDMLREEGIEVDLLSRPGDEVYEGGIERFIDLYGLRLMAVYLENNRDIAALVDGDIDDAEPDPLLAAIYEGTATTQYAHLVNHQGEGGYYIPADFPEPIWIEYEDEDEELDTEAEDDEEADDSVISFGSSIGLQRELVMLATKLQEANIEAEHPVMLCLTALRAAADASVSNDLPIIVW